MNMSYCRFRNTLGDLMDCHKNWDGDVAEAERNGDDEPLSREEAFARQELLVLCREIVEAHEDDEN